MNAKIKWAVGAALIGFSACQTQRPQVAYRLASGPYRARIHCEFSAARPGGGPKQYQALVDAWVRLRRGDTVAGLFSVVLTVDSVHYASSERDTQELAFMQEKLRHYQATWRMTPDGRVPGLTEEPELPQGEFNYRLGPLLAAALPVFPAAENASSATAIVDTQSLFDAAEPGRIMIQSMVGRDRNSGKQSVSGKRHWIFHLNGSGGAGTALAGEGAFQFDSQLGFPRAVDLDLSGDTPADTGSAAAVKFPMHLRFRYRFELVEPPSL